jgi:formylglycine-generating enzyme required for sulfatase activity
MNETELLEEIHRLEGKLARLDKAFSVFSSHEEVPESLRREKVELEKLAIKLRRKLVSLSDESPQEASDAGRGDFIFVIMPFKEPFNEYYEKIIRPTILNMNDAVLRSDEIYSPSSFVQTIWNSIINSKLVIAEMTGMNPNVLYELGLCHAINKTVVMIAQSMDYIPADLRHINCIIYNTSRADWAGELAASIQRMVEHIDKNPDRHTYLDPVAGVENTLYFESVIGEKNRLERELDSKARETLSLRKSVAEILSRKTELERIMAGLIKADGGEVVTRVNSESGTNVYTFPLRETGLAIELVKVSAGSFIHGFGERQEEEALDTFYISRFSITNRQYAAFLNHVGNRSEEGHPWVDLSGASPCDKCRLYFAGNEFKVEDGYDDHPVTYVNYFGSDAFCRWAGGELPTEAQWEKAIRGTDGRNYPWGNEPPNPDLANCTEEGWLRDVPPIEVYKKAKGRSPFGVVQGIGNVWHWTATYYSERNAQAVRGGSFFDFRVGHRSVYRFLVSPNGPDFSQGFLFSKRFLFSKEENMTK